VLRDLLIVWRLVRRALASHPQVLHFFKPKGYSGLAALLVWYLARLRLAKARAVLDSDDREGRGGWNDIGDYSWLQRHLFAWQEGSADPWAGTRVRADLSRGGDPVVLLYTPFFEFEAG
jgi:hypothetical protein